MDREAVLYVLPVLTVLVTLILILFKTEYSLGRKRQIYCFRMMLIGMIISMAFTALSTILISIGMPYDGHLFHGAVAICYVSMAFAFMNWINFAACTIKTSWEDKLWWKILLWVPLWILGALLVSPLYKRLIGTIPDQRNYVVGDETFVVIIDLLYLVIAVVIIGEGRSNIRSKSDVRIYRGLLFFMFCILFGEVLCNLINYAPIFELMVIPGTYVIYTELAMAQAYTDALTGLNNRRKIDEFIDNALVNASPERSVELFLIDLDYFKSINDVLGHNEGDKVLQLFAEALRRTPRLRGTVLGRYGGDEFILSAVAGPKDPEDLRKRLREQLDIICEQEGLPYHVSFSTGYAICTISGVTRAELIKRADDELYQEKERHHKKMRHYEAQLRKSLE